MLDILHHLADHCELLEGKHNLEARLAVPILSLIGNCMEGLSLWTLSPTTSLFDCMEVFSKGIHRALVPLHSQMEHVNIGVELAEASPGYRLLTQMGVLTFVVSHNADELQDVLGRTVEELGTINKIVMAVTNQDTLLHTIKAMRTASLNAVAIVDALQAHSTSTTIDEQLIDGKGRKLVGTFSSTDLRGYPVAEIGSWLHITIMEFTEKMTSTGPRTGEVNVAGNWAAPFRNKLLVTCNPHTSLGEAIRKAVAAHVHQVWVVDTVGLLGVVALTDMLRVMRVSVLD